MTGEEIIVTFKEPWYNDYTRRLYTQLSEQMIREEIERVHKEPIITNTAFDIAVDSQSENWAEGVTFPSSGKWVKMNNSGRVFRFTGGEIDLNIELYTASAQ